MSDSSDQPTSDGPLSPLDGETRDAPPAPEPGTFTARTHTHDSDPRTASLPLVGTTESFTEPPGFVILRELGSGGMGVVYEARQTKLNRMVALKVLKSGRGDTQSIIRFLKEGEAVAEIKHPNVVQVFEVGQSADGPFMALELLTGGTLSDRLRTSGRYDPREAAELLVKLAAAIQAAHDLGIVHRDMKPSNVLFDATGEPKITDFGLAKKTGGADLTRTQALMGTPAYMAPEQARGEARFVGPPADVWALGAILYECLTGKRAFEADDTWAVLRKVTDEAPPAPRTHVSGLPRDLELIALKCLEKSSADRYPSAAALAEDLENYLAGRPVSVRPAGPLERTTKWTKRNPTIAGATVAVFLALLVGSAVSLAFGIQAAHRGDDLAKVNGDLSRTNDNLTASQKQLADTNANLQLVGEKSEERGYLSDIALAHQLWKANDLRGMRAALERCPPNRRRWEWHYLDRISSPEREIIATDSVPLALAYSPDGKRLAFVTSAGTLSVRNLEPNWEGRDWFLFESREPTGKTCALAFRPDAKELAFCFGPRYWVLDLTNRQLKELTARNDDDTLQNPTSSYFALGYTKDGQLLSAEAPYPGIGKEMLFRICDLRSGKTIVTLNSGVKYPRLVVLEVGGASFNPDGTRFAASLVDSGLRVGFPSQIDKEAPVKPVVVVWDIKSTKLLGQMEGGSRVGSVVFEGNEGRMVGFGNRRTAAAFDPILSVASHISNAHTGEVLTVAFDAKNSVLWSAGEDKFVHGHDWVSETERFALRGCSNNVFRVAVTPDGKEVAAATGDILGGAGAVHRFDVAALEADVWRAPARDRVSFVNALSPDGTKFAASDFSFGGEKRPEPQFMVRDVAGRTERKLNSLSRFPRVAFRPDGGLVLLEGIEGGEWKEQLRFLGPDGKLEASIDLPSEERFNPPSILGATADGTTVATVSQIRFPAKEGERQPVGVRIVTWDSITRKQGKTHEVNLSEAVPPSVKTDRLHPTAAAFDSTGQKLAATFILSWSKDRGSVEYRGVVLVWDMIGGTELFRQFTLDPMRAVTFAPDGTLLTAGGSTAGGIVSGWDIRTGLRLFAMLGHTRPILAVTVGPDNRLATGGADRAVKVWDLASRREVLTIDGFTRDVTHLAFTRDGKNLVTATGMDRFDAMTSTAIPTDWPPAEVRTFRGPK